MLILSKKQMNDYGNFSIGSYLKSKFLSLTLLQEKLMNSKWTLIYWKGEKFWLGKLLEHPKIMTQGETVEELEENIKDAYLMMAMDNTPPSPLYISHL